MSADYRPALWVPGPMFGFPRQGDHGRMGHTPRYVIIHGTGWPWTLDQYIAEGRRTGGVHYMVGRDGRVVQFVQEADASWGNGKVEPGHDPWWTPALNPNLITFSVEHEKYSKTNTDMITPAQAAASFALVEHLCAKWNIPRRRADASGGITGHYSMEPVTRSFCPGPYPWAALFAYLNPDPAPTPPVPTSSPAESDPVAAYLAGHAGTLPAPLTEAFKAALAASEEKQPQ